MFRKLTLLCFLIIFICLIGCSSNTQTNDNRETAEYTEQDKQEAKKIAGEILSVFKKGKVVKHEEVSALMKHFDENILTMNDSGEEAVIDRVKYAMAEQDPLSIEENRPFYGLVEGSDDLTLKEIKHLNAGDVPYNLAVYNGTNRFGVIFIKKANKLLVVAAGTYSYHDYD